MTANRETTALGGFLPVRNAPQVGHLADRAELPKADIQAQMARHLLNRLYRVDAWTGRYGR
jgi:hypothetical protein